MKRSTMLVAAAAMAIALAGCGNRSIGNKIDDQFLAPDVSSSISEAHKDLSSPTSHIVVTSYNGVILLAGQTPRSDLKALAEQAAQRITNVRKVYNELQILEPTSLLARSNDTLLTSSIKTQMLADTNVPGSRIKVVTENGIVYLLGVVTQAEGTHASNLVQNVSGVQKVVKLFEYTN